jgi:hypothetical protein
MDKRFSQRKSGKILAAAAASVGLAGFASQADASLLIDLRAIQVAGGTGGSFTLGPKGVTLAPGATTPYTIIMGVYARVAGTNATQIKGDIDGNLDADDTMNDDGVAIATGSFKSTGGLLGNMNTVAGNLGYSSRATGFLDNGGVNGGASDWDSDGDLDIGNGGTDTAGMWSVRANPAAQAIAKNGSSMDLWKGSYQGNTDTKLIDPTTSEMRIGQIRFIVDASTASGNSNVNFVPRNVPSDQGTALWTEDGASTGKFGGNGGVFLAGSPVNVAIPEPSTVALAGIAGIGLLARRKKNA